MEAVPDRGSPRTDSPGPIRCFQELCHNTPSNSPSPSPSLSSAVATPSTPTSVTTISSETSGPAPTWATSQTTGTRTVPTSEETSPGTGSEIVTTAASTSSTSIVSANGSGSSQNPQGTGNGRSSASSDDPALTPAGELASSPIPPIATSPTNTVLPSVEPQALSSGLPDGGRGASPAITAPIQQGTPSGFPNQDAATSSKHRDHTGAIVGGVLGGLALLLLVTICTVLLRLRRRARRTAPSAEFMGIARGSTPGPPGGIPTPAALVRVEGCATPSRDCLLALPLPRADAGGDERPPMFTPGAYADPVFEKVRAAAKAAAMCEEYEGSSSTAHEEESTEEGFGAGASGDEKMGQYTWAI